MHVYVYIYLYAYTYTYMYTYTCTYTYATHTLPGSDQYTDRLLNSCRQAAPSRLADSVQSGDKS